MEKFSQRDIEVAKAFLQQKQQVHLHEVTAAMNAALPPNEKPIRNHQGYTQAIVRGLGWRCGKNTWVYYPPGRIPTHMQDPFATATCESCRFVELDGRTSEHACCLHPTPVLLDRDHWCGQWQARPWPIRTRKA